MAFLYSYGPTQTFEATVGTRAIYRDAPPVPLWSARESDVPVGVEVRCHTRDGQQWIGWFQPVPGLDAAGTDIDTDRSMIYMIWDELPGGFEGVADKIAEWLATPRALA